MPSTVSSADRIEKDVAMLTRNARNQLQPQS
jgi:hypothetical protein